MFNFFRKTDSEILRDVQNELKWDASFDAADIEVSVNNGAVSLKGEVPHFYEKYNAENAARRVGGVASVLGWIVIKPYDADQCSDSQIGEAARLALDWRYPVPKGLKVKVVDGFATLTGEVVWDYQRKAAYDAVASLMGVRGIDNAITISPKKINAAHVKEDIEDALKRLALIEGQNVNVMVSGDRVILEGNLDSFDEIETARIAAWNAPGVKSVVNNLTLNR